MRKQLDKILRNLWWMQRTSRRPRNRDAFFANFSTPQLLPLVISYSPSSHVPPWHIRKVRNGLRFRDILPVKRWTQNPVLVYTDHSLLASDGQVGRPRSNCWPGGEAFDVVSFSDVSCIPSQFLELECLCRVRSTILIEILKLRLPLSSQLQVVSWQIKQGKTKKTSQKEPPPLRNPSRRNSASSIDWSPLLRPALPVSGGAENLIYGWSFPIKVVSQQFSVSLIVFFLAFMLMEETASSISVLRRFVRRREFLL
jgi:hypothetical protein